MNILLLGQQVFRHELIALGHKVITAGTTFDKDIVLPTEEFTIANILAICNIPPDVCLFIEELGGRKFPKGIEKCPVPFIFYSIDTHLNFFWLRHLASICDCVITTQRDYVKELKNYCKQAFWLPWGYDAEQYRDLGLQRDLDITFVGTVGEYRPRRKMLLDRLGERFNLSVFTPTEGNWYSPSEISGIFSRSKIVVNEAISCEVNFRVFETLPTGAMLLTERVNNGFDDLFQDGLHLVSFTPFDFMEKADYYLNNNAERETIAMAGKKIAAEKHTRAVRAMKLSEILERCEKSGTYSCSQIGRCYFLMYRRGLLNGDHDFDESRNLLVTACSSSEGKGEDWLNLAEFCSFSDDIGNATSCYGESWNKGERSFRLFVQWALALLEAERIDDARKVLMLIMTLDLPEESKKGLFDAIQGHLPSDVMYLWLGRIAEMTPDHFRPGFFPLGKNSPPITGADLLQRGLDINPDSSDILEGLGDVHLENNEYVAASAYYLDAICRGRDTSELYYKTATSLAFSFRKGDALPFARRALQLRANTRNLTLLKKLECSAATFQSV